MSPEVLAQAERGGVAEAKAHLSSIVARIERGGSPYVIMRYNKPVAVIAPLEGSPKPARRARGLLAGYADASKRAQEDRAFAEAMVRKHEHLA